MNLLEQINAIIPNDIKAKIKEFKATFDAQTPPVTTIAEPIKMEDVKLIDGTILSVDKLEVGGTAMQVSADGTMVVAIDGTYEAENGDVITIVAGLITDYKAKEVEPKVEEPNEAMAKLEARLSVIENKYTEMSSMNSTLKTELSKVNEATKVTLSAITSITSLSAGAPIEKQINSKFNAIASIGNSKK